MARPAIAVCAAPLRACWGPWDLDALLAPRDDVDAVQAAGALALLFGPDPAHVADPDELLDRVDGLLLAGGQDGDAQTPAAGADPRMIAAAAGRDAFELAVVRRALERDLPFLGIGRGMLVMNVARGGTQRLDRVGSGLVVSGPRGADGAPGALMLAGNRFALGVRRPPERDELSRLVAALVAPALGLRDGAGRISAP